MLRWFWPLPFGGGLSFAPFVCWAGRALDPCAILGFRPRPSVAKAATGRGFFSLRTAPKKERLRAFRRCRSNACQKPIVTAGHSPLFSIVAGGSFQPNADPTPVSRRARRPDCRKRTGGVMRGKSSLMPQGASGHVLRSPHRMSRIGPNKVNRRDGSRIETSIEPEGARRRDHCFCRFPRIDRASAMPQPPEPCASSRGRCAARKTDICQRKC